jgi:very-short-patch-repair endonuclease
MFTRGGLGLELGSEEMMLKRVGSEQAEAGSVNTTALGHLGALRRKLLDLSTINRLIHFPHAERARNYVRVVDEVPEHLHEKLLTGRALRIAQLDDPEQREQAGPAAETSSTKEARRPPAEVVARSRGIAPSFELPEPSSDGPRKHLDDVVQTLLYPDVYQKTLAKIADVTRTASEEQGIHSLFAAFGFVEWYERKDSAVPRYAPLMLFPVELTRERRPSGHVYAVTAHDDAPELNIALMEKLAREFDLRLPEWPEDDSLGTYFAEVKAAIASKREWKLHRWITLANFSSARIAMYHDLDAEKWPPGASPHEHPVFQSLTCDRSSQRETRWSDENEEVAQRADELESLVLDSDSSQVAAILEAMEERDLVIKGPPGTGKSQTIANLIATALHRNLRVLFVAEKMAALEVVKDRLDRAGLGEFCLELHSLKATRRAVLDSLARRIALESPVIDRVALQRQRAHGLRQNLHGYVAALHSTPGALGVTVHQLIWRRERARKLLGDVVTVVESVGIPQALHLSPHELDRTRHLLASIVQAEAERDAEDWSGDAVIWRELRDASVEEADAVGRLQDFREGVQRVLSLASALAGQLIHMLSLDQFFALLSLNDTLQDGVFLRQDLVGALRDATVRDGLRAHVLLSLRALELDELVQQRGHRAITIEALPVLRACMDVLTDAPRHVALRDLVESSRSTQTQIRLTSDELARAKALLEFSGYSDTCSSEAVLVLRDVLASIEQTDPAILRALRAAPAVLQFENRDQLSGLSREVAQLTLQSNEIVARVNIGEARGEVLRNGHQLAVALRRPFWFAWLFGAYWAARRLHGRIARTAARNAAQAAQDLIDTADFHARVAEFESRDVSRALAGTLYRGSSTDFELLLQACEWAEQTRRSFSRMHRAAATLRALLLTGDLERLWTLQGEAKQQSLASAWTLATDAVGDPRPLESVLKERTDQARSVEEAAGRLMQLGVATNATLEDVGELIPLLEERSALSSKGASSRPVLERLKLPVTLSRAELVSLSETTGAVELASRLGLPLVVVAALSSAPVRARLKESATAVRRDVLQARQRLAELGVEARIARWSSEALADAVPFADVAIAARRQLRVQLQYLMQVERGRSSCAREMVELAAAKRLAAPQLIDATEFAIYDRLIVEATRLHPGLRSQSGSELEAVRAQFREIDKEILSLNAKSIARELLRVEVPRGVASGRKSEWTERALIEHESTKKVRHLPLRQLLERAGGAIRALKPCVMMSPLSAAQFLPRMRDQFDLVVIDEASQMRPEDAIGALVRARRAVVVGDPKQLPPTSFFRSLQASADPEEEGVEDEELDAESILDLGQVSFGEPRDLRWHYRSRHPSLIAFSNEHFYDGRLKVFPAPQGARGDLGVHLVHTGGEYATSINRIEAERVADAVLAHIRDCPNRSLGVVTMNMKQRDLILDCLSERKDDAFSRFEESGANGQSFFVKSLENVQGDERDVIFVSMTYGPSPGTKRVLQRFGPINGVYGARRLNVLFTRARERLVVFSSLRPEDVLADETSSPGLRALKNYLVYAERGELSAVTRNDGNTESAFEDSVREVLSGAGFETEAQVGVQGFFIDLGVKRPNRPGFFCGVECDGASYHSQRSVRDRDRLRQEVLEAQGWRIVRVWSTDWFRNPVGAREKLLAQVRECARS